MSASGVLNIPRNAKIRRTPRPGPRALFRGKRRAPVTITLTPDHHLLVNAAMGRLGLSRADVIGLLIAKYASTVTTDGIWPNDVDPQRRLPYEDHLRSRHANIRRMTGPVSPVPYAGLDAGETCERQPERSANAAE